MFVELKRIILSKEKDYLDNTAYFSDVANLGEESEKTVCLDDSTKTELNKAWEDYKNQNYNSAVLVFKKHAEEGDAEAQLILSNLYRDGHGVKQDDETADFWLKKSVDSGNVSAKFTYGMRLISSGGQDIKKIEKGLSYLEEVADKNDKSAMRNYIETIMEKQVNQRIANKAIYYCEYLIKSATDLCEKEKYENYLTKLRKVLSNAKFSSVKKITASVFSIVGSMVLVIGALYIFVEANHVISRETAILNLLPEVSYKKLLPINILWEILGKFIYSTGMFGLQCIFIANILLTIGNVYNRFKICEIVNVIARYLCFAIALLYFALGLKNSVATGQMAGEKYALIIGIYAISLVGMYAAGVLVGNVIKKVAVLFDKSVRRL